MDVGRVDGTAGAGRRLGPAGWQGGWVAMKTAQAAPVVRVRGRFSPLGGGEMHKSMAATVPKYGFPR